MKKITAVIFVLLIMTAAINFFGCRERSVGVPGPEAAPTDIPTPMPALLMFDDFEDGNGDNALGGSWYSMGGPTNIANALATPGYNASAYAMTLTAYTGASCGWGVWLAGPVNAAASATDMTAYNGIRFYARDINPGTYYCGFFGETATGNHYKHAFNVTSSWTQVSIPFSSMTQGTTDGVTVNQALAVATLFFWGVPGTECTSSRNMSLWIDNIELF